jgi:threonine dehydratase
MKQYAARQKRAGQSFVAVACGANMNFDRLRFVAERAELGEQREALFAATIPEKPGSFRSFLDLLGQRQITEFNYRFADQQEAQIFVGVTTQNREESGLLFKNLRQHGIKTIDLRDNEMAKLHLRHMVGGRAVAANELLYRFEFPERPGALRTFLTTIGERWNISLFHYRNHGADYGRVLVGLQVPPAERKALQGFLRQLAYPWVEETSNPAYRLFL